MCVCVCVCVWERDRDRQNCNICSTNDAIICYWKNIISRAYIPLLKRGGRGNVGFCNQHPHCMSPFQLLNKLNDFKTLGMTIMQLRTQHIVPNFSKLVITPKCTNLWSALLLMTRPRQRCSFCSMLGVCSMKNNKHRQHCGCTMKNGATHSVLLSPVIKITLCFLTWEHLDVKYIFFQHYVTCVTGQNNWEAQNVLEAAS